MQADRAASLQRGIRLEWATVAWMAIEAAGAVAAGVVARSVLLTAFGVDSVIELLSGITVLLRLRAEQGAFDETRVGAIERRAVRVSAVLLVLLCAYVVVSAIAGLVLQVQPEPSWWGGAIAALAVVAMPWLAARKRSVNRTLQSGALRADIAESASCAYLAGVTLAGLLVSAVTGWWWFQYIAAFGLLAWLIPETREAIEAARS